MPNLNNASSTLALLLRKYSKRSHPAILLCGEKSAGKKTFLLNAGLHQVEEITCQVSGVQLINTDKALFVVIEEIAKLKAYASAIKKYMTSVLWIIDAPHLLAHQSLVQYRDFLLELPASISIYIAISSADRLKGFFDFFADIKPLDAEQTLGFALTDQKHPERTFLQKLYQPLVQRLHDERSPEKRKLIFELPLQIEYATRHLLNETELLNQKHRIAHVFYFAAQKSYFIKNIIPTLLSKKWMPGDAPRGVRYWQWLALPITPIALIFATFYIHQAFLVNDAALSKAQMLINAPSDGNFNVTQLNILQEIHETFSNTPKWPASIGFYQTFQIEKQSELLYNTLLKNQFKAELIDTLKRSIGDNLNKNRLDLYNALATYLMLTSPEHFDSNAITQWFTLYWRKQYASDNKMQLQMQAHLHTLLSETYTPSYQDKALVLEARSFLSTLSASELAFLRLQSQYSKADVSPLGPERNIPGVNLSNATIPLFYDTNNFKKIVHTDIPALVNTINDDNWVLGITTKAELTEAEKTSLREQVQKIYVDNFASQWGDLLRHVQLAEPKTLQEVERSIHLLTDKDSAFLQLLKEIVSNANISNNPNSSANKIMVQAIMELSNQTNQFQKLFTDLNALQKSLGTVSTSKDKNQASFELTSQYYSTPSQNNVAEITQDINAFPEPIKGWVSAITNASLNRLLENTQSYVNGIWQKTVVPFYAAKINNQFPLFPESATDVSFTDFKTFFGPKGLIDHFFTHYLDPFVDTTSAYWTFKKINGKGIGIEQKKLNLFIRASLIQEMFFTNNPDKISFSFYLTPISVNPSFRTFSLNIDGQAYRFTPKSRGIVKFTWPGPKSGMASITFTPKKSANDDEENTPTNITQNGAWAWFRLVNTATLRPGINAQLFTLSFANQEKKVRFTLLSDNLMNPYLPNIITKFRSPDSL
jgi:type VI protein secretion system component VasK